MQVAMCTEGENLAELDYVMLSALLDFCLMFFVSKHGGQQVGTIDNLVMLGKYSEMGRATR